MDFVVIKNMSKKYNDQIVNLQNQKILLKAECLKNYGFDPNSYTIDKAEDFYIAYESPMRKGVKEAYNKFIYELIKAQEEEKGAEGLL